MTADPLSARVVVSTINYGGADLILSALPALIEELSRFAEGLAVIVDNASPDGDGDRLEAGIAAMGSPASVRVIRSPVNGGFAAGNNLTFAAAKALPWTPDAILLLNPDAELRPGAIEELVRVMQSRPRVGVVGAQLENPDGKGRVAAFRFPSAMRELVGASHIGPLQRLWPGLIPPTDVPARADWVTGAAMLINRELIDELGPMDEGYFLYFEEVDYQLQAHRAGWEIWYAPQARVMHLAGALTGIAGNAPKKGRMPAYWFDSWRRYFEKNHGSAYASAAAAMKLAGMAVGGVVGRLRGREVREIPHYRRDFARRCMLNRSLSNGG